MGFRFRQPGGLKVRIIRPVAGEHDGLGRGVGVQKPVGGVDQVGFAGPERVDDFGGFSRTYFHTDAAALAFHRVGLDAVFSMRPGFMGTGLDTQQALGTIRFCDGGGAGPGVPHFHEIFFCIRENIGQGHPGRTGRLAPAAVKTVEHFVGRCFRKFQFSGQQPEGGYELGPGGIRLPSREFEQRAVLKTIAASNTGRQGGFPFLQVVEPGGFFCFHRADPRFSCSRHISVRWQ